MKRALFVTAVLTVVAIGGAALWAVAGGKTTACSKEASACDPAACETGSKSSVASTPSGKVLGKFDVSMAGCRFACATKVKYDAKDVVAQPGVKNGKLTQCPVSGVVFNVDAKRPHVQIRHRRLRDLLRHLRGETPEESSPFRAGLIPAVGLSSSLRFCNVHAVYEEQRP